jgi:hypothetical protein
MAQESVENLSADGQQAEQELVPQDDRFWKRYSPHHEFPLSSAASVALHVMAIAVLILGGILAARWGFGDSEKPIPLSMLDEPGGGGQSDGNPTGAGGDAAVQPKEAASNESKSNALAQAPTTPKETLTDPKADPLALPEIQDAQGRFINESNDAIQGLKKLDEAARKKLFNSLADPAKGKGGTGTGGGKGAGAGPGTGSGTGPGEGTLSKRQKRMLRWKVNFDLRGYSDRDLVQDHIRQFAALQAILAVPNPQGRCYVFRDLNERPPTYRVEDISGMDRIPFFDRDPKTAFAFGRELNLPFTPRVLIVFFPKSLEERLVQLEEQFRGQKEDDIREEIQFVVVRQGGTYDVIIRPGQ